MTAARRIAGFATALHLEAVPAPLVEAAKLHLLDALGVGLAASRVAHSARWIAGARRIGGSGRSTALGDREGLSSTAAALLNGALIHSLEFDDTHVASVVHGSAVAASTALAAAEAAGCDGGRMLAGYLVAWEVMVRLGLSAPGAFQANGFQVTAAGGAIGAAAAAAAIAGLDEDAAVSALGIAGSQASGLMAFLGDGSTVKALHPGWAAHTGVAATALATAGMTGPAGIVEGRFGFLEAFARDPAAAGRLDTLLGDLGTHWHLPDAAFKLFPCCHYIHPFLEALQRLIDDGLSVDNLAELTCEVPAPEAPLICEPWERRQHPASGYDGKWGLAYCLAVLLVDGVLTVDSFDRPPDDRIVAVARRMAWRPMADHRFPQRFEAAIEARLTDGSVRRARVDDVRGTPGRPVPAAEVQAKFEANAGRVFEPAAVAAVRDAVLDLDRDRPVAALSRALRTTAADPR